METLLVYESFDTAGGALAGRLSIDDAGRIAVQVEPGSPAGPRLVEAVQAIEAAGSTSWRWQAAEASGMLVFRRRDVKPSEPLYPLAVSDCLASRYGLRNEFIDGEGDAAADW